MNNIIFTSGFAIIYMLVYGYQEYGSVLTGIKHLAKFIVGML
jgi:hypothetical protein